MTQTTLRREPAAPIRREPGTLPLAILLFLAAILAVLPALRPTPPEDNAEVQVSSFSVAPAEVMGL